MTARVLICDEVPLVREGLQTLLDAQPDIEVVATTDDVEEALDLARTHRPQAALIGMSRVEASIELIGHLNDGALNPGPPAHCLVFYSELAEQVLPGLLRAGARGMMSRAADSYEVIAAVRAVSRGRTAMTTDIAEHLLAWFLEFGDTHRGEVPTGTTALTDREREVLRFTGQGLSIDDVAATLYISVSTVRTHLHRIRHKLNLRDRAQMVAFAHQTGLIRGVA